MIFVKIYYENDSIGVLVDPFVNALDLNSYPLSYNRIIRKNSRNWKNIKLRIIENLKRKEAGE